MLDAVLGELSERDNDLTGQLIVDGAEVELTIMLDGAAPEEVIPAARELQNRLAEMIERARRELVQAFLPTVNGGYLEPGQEPLDEVGFLKRATLDGIELEIDAEPREGAAALALNTVGSRVAFHFQDGGMLWGHWMTVEVWHGTEWRAEMWG